MADKLVQAGRKGQKTRRGFYDYTQGRQPVRDTAVEEIIVATSAELGIPRREISDREIVERCIFGLVNGVPRPLCPGPSAAALCTTPLRRSTCAAMRRRLAAPHRMRR